MVTKCDWFRLFQNSNASADIQENDMCLTDGYSSFFDIYLTAYWINHFTTSVPHRVLLQLRAKITKFREETGGGYWGRIPDWERSVSSPDPCGTSTT